MPCQALVRCRAGEKVGERTFLFCVEGEISKDKHMKTSEGFEASVGGPDYVRSQESR